MEKKHYTEVAQAEAATYWIHTAGQELEERLFHRAQARLRLVDGDGREVLMLQESVNCLARLCGVSDFAKVFLKAQKELELKFNYCQSSIVSILQ